MISYDQWWNCRFLTRSKEGPSRISYDQMMEFLLPFYMKGRTAMNLIRFMADFLLPFNMKGRTIMISYDQWWNCSFLTRSKEGPSWISYDQMMGFLLPLDAKGRTTMNLMRFIEEFLLSFDVKGRTMKISYDLPWNFIFLSMRKVGPS